MILSVLLSYTHLDIVPTRYWLLAESFLFLLSFFIIEENRYKKKKYKKQNLPCDLYTVQV